MRFQLRVIRKETDMPLPGESEGTLPCCDVSSVLPGVSHVIIFHQICALTPDILFPSPPTQRA